MARSSTTFSKGHRRVGGRQKGTTNKITQEHRNRIAMFFDAHWDEFENEIWNELTPKEKKDTFVSMMNYQFPKLSSVDVKRENHTDNPAIQLLKDLVGDDSII